MKSGNRVFFGFRPAAPDPPEDVGGFGGKRGRESRFKVQFRRAKELEPFSQVVFQEWFSVFQRFQCLRLFLRRSMQQNSDMSLAKIWRKEGFCDVDGAYSGVFQFVANQLFEFFAHAF